MSPEPPLPAANVTSQQGQGVSADSSVTLWSPGALSQERQRCHSKVQPVPVVKVAASTVQPQYPGKTSLSHLAGITFCPGDVRQLRCDKVINVPSTTEGLSSRAGKELRISLL